MWTRKSAREFETVWWALRFDDTDKLIGRSRIRGRITFGDSPDQYTARYDREFLDLEGRSPA